MKVSFQLTWHHSLFGIFSPQKTHLGCGCSSPEEINPKDK
jgi:hypothetical protein